VNKWALLKLNNFFTNVFSEGLFLENQTTKWTTAYNQGKIILVLDYKKLNKEWHFSKFSVIL